MNWDMIGHQWAVTLLKQHIAADHIRHAYLISGDDGVGKRTLGERFAQALLCEQSELSDRPCRECRACSRVAISAHADLHVLIPEEGSRSLKIDQVRALQQKLALSPYEGRWRIALIPDFELATENAANALLKTLEEPGDRVIVILTAIDSASLLPTIVSRCEQLPLRAVPEDDISEAIEQAGTSGDQGELLAALAQGRPGWALRYAEDPKLLEAREKRIQELKELLPASRADRFDYVEKLFTRKDDLETQRGKALAVLQIWMSLWRDALQGSLNAGVDVINHDQRDLIQRLNSELTPEQLHETVLAIQRTQHAIDRFANLRLAMEVLMLDFPLIGM